MHITMGKRLSGCDTKAEFPAGSGEWMPMMMGMGGGMWPMDSEFNSFNNNSMMGYGLGGFGGGIVMILFWVLIIVGIIALVRYTMDNSAKSGSSKSALDILKERYAKGEIDKNEFEAKKKDLQG